MIQALRDAVAQQRPAAMKRAGGPELPCSPLGRLELNLTRKALRRVADMAAASDSVHVARSPPQIAVAVPCARSNLRRDTQTPPQQTGVYVPRRLACQPTRGAMPPDARLIRSRQRADLGRQATAAAAPAAPAGAAPSRRTGSRCPPPSRSIGTCGARQRIVTAYSRIVTPVRARGKLPRSGHP